MLLALGLVSLSAGLSADPWEKAIKLEQLVLQCDEIVRGRILAVHDVGPGTVQTVGGGDRVPAAPAIHVIELRVLQVYWGEPSLTSRYLIDDGSSEVLLHHGPLEKDDESIWFLESEHYPSCMDPETLKQIAQITGRASRSVAALNGRGRVRIEERAENPVACIEAGTWDLPKGVSSSGSHVTKNPDRTWTKVALSEFVSWLETSVRISTPSVEVIAHGSGPSGCPSVTIDNAGHAERLNSPETGDKALELGRQGIAAILEVARREAFLDLPPRIGSSLGPDSTWYQVRIRTVGGGRVVRIDGPVDPVAGDRESKSAFTRVMRVWDAIPLARDWKITGH